MYRKMEEKASMHLMRTSEKKDLKLGMKDERKNSNIKQIQNIGI